MTPFLKQVAAHYHSAGRLDEYCFVFPNRRAMVFFREYLGDCVREAGVPCLTPEMCTMNDFFYRITGASPSGQVALLLELYDCYCRLNPSHETLDEFIFWGGVLLSDFDDIDKYLVKPDALFANVSEFRELQDGYDYLEEGQLAAIRRFVSHFRTGGRYKDEFRKIWDILLPLYRAFNDRLRSRGLSYEGQVYRELAERLDSESASDVLGKRFPGTRKFVFVGLNALNECEKLLMRKLRNAGLAEFCWDWSSRMIKDPHNRSSFFMSANVEEFPQAFRPDPEGLPLPEVNVLSVPSAVGQAKQLPSILRRLDARGIETAVVLPDENMLIPVLNSIPPEIAGINVTMGYPMSSGGLWSLMNDIAALQMHLREKDGRWYFYRETVWSIFADSVFHAVMTPEDEETASAVRKEAGYYISEEQLASTPLFRSVFRAVAKRPAVADPDAVTALQDYQLEVVETLDNMSWSGSARYSTHQRHGANALTEFTGLDPDQITFDITLSVELGVDPMAEVTSTTSRNSRVSLPAASFIIFWLAALASPVCSMAPLTTNSPTIIITTVEEKPVKASSGVSMPSTMRAVRAQSATMSERTLPMMNISTVRPSMMSVAVMGYRGWLLVAWLASTILSTVCVRNGLALS